MTLALTPDDRKLLRAFHIDPGTRSLAGMLGMQNGPEPEQDRILFDEFGNPWNEAKATQFATTPEECLAPGQVFTVITPGGQRIEAVRLEDYIDRMKYWRGEADRWRRKCERRER